VSEENKAVVQRFIDEVWNNRNYDLIESIFAEDHVNHDPADPNPAGGPQGARDFVVTLHVAFPDARIEIDDMIAEGDRVVIRWHSTGTHQGELMGIPASGRSATTTGIGIDRFRDGVIVESWTNWDTLGLLAQIGALPSPAGS
jgi:steroid delta-isomerase-like uncharacterized protein